MLKYSAIILLILLTSCASTNRSDILSPEESDAMAGKSFTNTAYKFLPDFPVRTSKNILWGNAGMAAAVSHGNAMIANNNIKDPAIDIAVALSEGLSSKLKLAYVNNESSHNLSNRISELTRLHHDFDYVLDVQTVLWLAAYYVNATDKYNVLYSAKFRLIDTKTKIVVAEAGCFNVPTYDDMNLAPSYQDLENGKGLKKELKRSIDFCINHIRKEANLF